MIEASALHTIKAVIFDVDGTLVDSVDAHAAAWQSAFAEFGHREPFAKVRSQIGKGGDQLLPVFLSEDELQAHGDAVEQRRAAIFKERYRESIRGFPAVRELFKRLQADGIQTILASSAKGAELDFYKQRAGIMDLVAEATSSDDAEHSKPEADIFEAAIARLPHIPHEQMIVVGDTPYDAEAAAKAGLPTIGVLCGGFAESDLRNAGCIAIFRDPADLLANYARLPLV